jgi:hypothetical protein
VEQQVVKLPRLQGRILGARLPKYPCPQKESEYAGDCIDSQAADPFG